MAVCFKPDEKVVLSATFSVSQDNKSLLDLLDKYDVDISDGEIFFFEKSALIIGQLCLLMGEE